MDGDIYGLDFWENFANRRYEPDTQSLIEAFCNSQTIFLDIGAAYGSMSILAATYGAKVYSYEPNPQVFQGLNKNASLNKHSGADIQTFNVAVGSETSLVDLNSNSSNHVLTPIVFTNWETRSRVQIVALTDILEKLLPEMSKGFGAVIKMDIEGAEWQILKDLNTLNMLKSTKSVLILALHPGLQRPVKNINSIVGRLRFYLWNIRNLLDSWFLFRRISPYSSIYRTNLNQVRRPTVFCLLVLAGNHEFVVSFRDKL